MKKFSLVLFTMCVVGCASSVVPGMTEDATPSSDTIPDAVLASDAQADSQPHTPQDAILADAPIAADVPADTGTETGEDAQADVQQEAGDARPEDAASDAEESCGPTPARIDTPLSLPFSTPVGTGWSAYVLSVHATGRNLLIGGDILVVSDGIVRPGREGAYTTVGGMDYDLRSSPAIPWLACELRHGRVHPLRFRFVAPTRSFIGITMHGTTQSIDDPTRLGRFALGGIGEPDASTCRNEGIALDTLVWVGPGSYWIDFLLVSVDTPDYYRGGVPQRTCVAQFSPHS